MVIEKGVEMVNVCKQIKKVLPIINLVFYEAKNVLVITATNRGRDILRLSHEAGHAIDVMFPLVDYPTVRYKLQGALGFNYHIRNMKTHLHIEYLPWSEKPLRRMGENHER